MKKLLYSIPLLLLAVGLVSTGPTGCHTPKLDPNGAYATNGLPDPQFYVTDAAYQIAYSAIDAAFTFEMKNETMLWATSPNIKHDLDAIRGPALQVRNAYSGARVAYIANPTPVGLTNLQTILAKAKQLAAAATAALPK